MSEATALVRYDQARRAVAECARVDEAAELRNKADKLRAYAKQAKDHELQRWAAEIQLRATIKLGQLSRDIEKAEPHGRGPVSLPTTGKRKADTLADAGISTTVAHRAEALTGRSDLDDESGLAVEALGVALQTAEVYFEQCREAEEVPNHKQLDAAIQGALDDKFGKPERARPHKRSAETNAFVDWTAAVRTIATLDADLNALAEHSLCALPRDLTDARNALGRLNEWLELMEGKGVDKKGRDDVSTRSVPASA